MFTPELMEETILTLIVSRKNQEEIREKKQYKKFKGEIDIQNRAADMIPRLFHYNDAGMIEDMLKFIKNSIARVEQQL